MVKIQKKRNRKFFLKVFLLKLYDPLKTLTIERLLI